MLGSVAWLGAVRHMVFVYRWWLSVQKTIVAIKWLRGNSTRGLSEISIPPGTHSNSSTYMFSWTRSNSLFNESLTPT